MKHTHRDTQRDTPVEEPGAGKHCTASFHDKTDFWKLRESTTADRASGCSTCSMSVKHATTADLSAVLISDTSTQYTTSNLYSRINMQHTHDGSTVYNHVTLTDDLRVNAWLLTVCVQSLVLLAWVVFTLQRGHTQMNIHKVIDAIAAHWLSPPTAFQTEAQTQANFWPWPLIPGAAMVKTQHTNMTW